MRTDKHSPTNFDPSLYSYIGSFDNDPPRGSFLNENGPSQFETDFGTIQAFTFVHAEYLTARRLLSEFGCKIHFIPGESSQCDHCGAHIRYIAVWRHESGEYIATGEICATNAFGHSSRMDYDISRLKKNAENERERERIFGMSYNFVKDNCPELEEWLLTPKCKEVHPIFSDLSSKLRKWGNLSEKQVAFARKLFNEYRERLANGGKTLKEIQFEEEKAKAEDCPNGKVMVNGKIVKITEKDSDWGPVTKLIVKDTRGFLVYVSKPSGFTVEPGNYVSFMCGLTRSDKDPKFGFGKRPTRFFIEKENENAV